jgi:hypothetical protein
MRLHHPWIPLTALSLLLSGSASRLDRVEVKGLLQPATREVTGTITTAVRTPFGNVPVTGQVHGRYLCDSSFSGTLRYGTVVRVLARVRGATLVNVAEARIESDEPWDCQAGHEHFTAHLALQDTILTGRVTYGNSSIPVSGSVQVVGDRIFHSRLSTPPGSGGYTVHATFQER